MKPLPQYSDIVSAAERLAGHAVLTPLLRNDVLDELAGGRIFLKAENLQRTGSFKFRGGYNSVSQLPDTVSKGGVVACSSGNHAQGVAAAAAMFGYPATIVMPSDAPQTKRDRTRRLGATVVEYDRFTEDRDAIAGKIASETGATFIHPYEHFDVIAGQGTAGLEICHQMAALGQTPDDVVVCAGGGGLMAGILLTMEQHFPNATVYPAEPVGHDDQARSHASGVRQGGNVQTTSLCDAIVTPMPGEKSFAICSGKLGAGLTISDEEALAAVAFAYREMRIVLEPGGAAALAAILSGKLETKGRCVVATLSGGNVDDDVFKQALDL
ncbi:threonine/serine dehydratase [Ahrensia sp. R2A130]|uniref:threonine ammonia-lyase n=1 Tax=Ahrensia sp. R2A130 TaxID=744979 RepID=UPI0001E0E866|nr:threonine/serine dehydratase [Ahrensia sp. R2A130]EFL90396.1 threo-3-hydroxyaspartate ammonia-lyase [Ahrensia sp. R2A130]